MDTALSIVSQVLSSDLFSVASKYTLPLVIGLFVLYTGYKTTKKGFQVAKTMLGWCNPVVLAVATMLVTGLGSTGLGFGDMIAKGTSKPGDNKRQFTSHQLFEMALKGQPDNLKEVLKYVEHTHGDDSYFLYTLLDKNLEASASKDNVDSKSLLAYVNYLRSKEDAKGRDLNHLISKAIEEPEAKTTVNNTWSWPTDWALALGGLGACGVALYVGLTRRLDPKPVDKVNTRVKCPNCAAYFTPTSN